MNKKIVVNFLIGLIFSTVAMYVLFSKFTFQDLAAGFERINYFWLTLTIITILLSMMVRTKVWSYLVCRDSFVDMKKLFYILMFGYAVNNILPARLGDISRIYVCWKELRISRSLTIVSLMIEKLLDLVWLSAFLLVVLFFMKSYTDLFYENSILFIIIFVFLLLLLFILYFYRVVVINFIRERFIGKQMIISILNKITEIIGAVPNKMIVARALLLHLFTWFLSLMAVWFSTKAFGLEISPMVALLILVLTNLGMLVPSTPGAIGIYHYLTYIALIIYNIDNTTASTFAIFLHLVQYLTVVIVGLISWILLSILSKSQTSLNVKQFFNMKDSINKTNDISLN